MRGCDRYIAEGSQFAAVAHKAPDFLGLDCGPWVTADDMIGLTGRAADAGGVIALHRMWAVAYCKSPSVRLLVTSPLSKDGDEDLASAIGQAPAFSAHPAILIGHVVATV